MPAAVPLPAVNEAKTRKEFGKNSIKLRIIKNCPWFLLRNKLNFNNRYEKIKGEANNKDIKITSASSFVDDVENILIREVDIIRETPIMTNNLLVLSDSTLPSSICITTYIRGNQKRAEHGFWLSKWARANGLDVLVMWWSIF